MRTATVSNSLTGSVLPPEEKRNVERAIGKGYRSWRACEDCERKPLCPSPRQRKGLVTFAPHALLPSHRSSRLDLSPPFFIDEDPSNTLIDCSSLDLAELAQLAASDIGQRPPFVEAWLAPRRALLDLVGTAMGLLIFERRHAPAPDTRYAWRLGDEKWRSALIKAAITERNLGSALEQFRNAHDADPVPPLPSGELLRDGRFAKWPYPFLDDLLEALAVEGTDQNDEPKIACAVLVGTGDWVKAWLELRRLIMDALPEGVIIADATGYRIWPYLGATTDRPVRISRRRVLERPDAVDRQFIQTQTLSRNELFARGKLDARGDAAVARAMKFIFREANLSESPRVAVLSHKAVTDALDMAWHGDEHAPPRISAALETLRKGKNIGGLLTGFYFGGARGTDTMRDYDALLMLGDPIPDISAVGEDGRLIAHAAALQGNTVTPEGWTHAIACCEKDQAEGRLRAILAEPGSVKTIVYAGRTQPDAQEWANASVAVLPRGRPTSEAAACVEDITATFLETFEAVSPRLITLISNKPVYFRGILARAINALKGTTYRQFLREVSDEEFASIATLSQRTLQAAVNRVAGKFDSASTANPTCPGREGGRWTWREIRSGAAAEFADLIRQILADTPEPAGGGA